jgi:hypothetical protein
LKIVGVVNDYKEALEIEDIVKVFVVKQRISSLLPLERNSSLKNESSDLMIFKTNNIDYINNSNGKNINEKNNGDNSPVFNVRGLI